MAWKFSGPPIYHHLPHVDAGQAAVEIAPTANQASQSDGLARNPEAARPLASESCPSRGLTCWREMPDQLLQMLSAYLLLSRELQPGVFQMPPPASWGPSVMTPEQLSPAWVCRTPSASAPSQQEDRPSKAGFAPAAQRPVPM